MIYFYKHSSELIEHSFGKPMCLLRYTIRKKTGNQKKKKKIVRTKVIPWRAWEPAELSIYAPLRRFRINLCPAKN